MLRVTRLTALSATTALLTGMSGVAAAQSPDPAARWRVTPFVGAIGGGDAETNRPTGGVAIGVGRSRWLELEAELSVAANLAAETAQPDTDLLLGSGTLLVSPWLTRPVAVYAVTGGTLARLSRRPAGAGAGATVEIGFVAGGGVRVSVTPRLAWRADIRFIHLDDAPNFWRATAGLSITVRSSTRSQAAVGSVPARAVR